MTVEELEGSPNGTDIVLGLNIRGDGRQDMVKYIESTGKIPRRYLFISPTSHRGRNRFEVRATRWPSRKRFAKH